MRFVTAPSALVGEAALRRAEAFARAVHAGQRGLLGEAFIVHPQGVAERLADVTAQTVAWLHDTVERTPTTTADLLAEGFTTEVVDAVDAISRRDGEALTDYLDRVLADELALTVKWADLADNLRPERIALLPESERHTRLTKYLRSLAHLQEGTAAPRRQLRAA